MKKTCKNCYIPSNWEVAVLFCFHIVAGFTSVAPSTAAKHGVDKLMIIVDDYFGTLTTRATESMNSAI